MVPQSLHGDWRTSSKGVGDISVITNIIPLLELVNARSKPISII